MNKTISNSIIVAAIEAFFVLFYFLLTGYNGCINTIVLVVLANIIIGIVVISSNNRFGRHIVLLSMIRLLLLLLIFHLGWKYTLETGNSMAGYDPERYYYQAIELIQNGFVLRAGIVNYAGIIYFYGILFKLFGANPVVPIIVNNMFTMISVVMLSNLMDNEGNAVFSTKLKKGAIALFAFLPELLWYDVLSSRESVCMAFVFISIYCISRMINDRISAKRVFVIVVLVLLVGIIRMAMVLPIICAAIIIPMFSNDAKVSGKKFILLVMVVGCLVVLPSLATNLGSTKSSYLSLFDSTSASNVLSDAGYNWSSNSIGQKLIADTPLKMIILAPIRMGVYLITPLPSFNVNFEGMGNGLYSAWQGLYVLLSSISYLVMIPTILASIIAVLKKKTCILQNKQFVIVFLVLLATVACGNQIIHERYRIVVIPWIILSYYYGRIADKRTRGKALTLFMELVVAAFFAYVLIKFI